jgi:fructokinase
MKRLTKPDLLKLIADKAKGKARILVAIAGAPGSGKSTLAEELAEHLADAAVLPMDGFHLDNAILEARGQLDRKGAPETFDLGGFASIIARLMTEPEVAVPIFDRTRDLSIGSAELIDARMRTVVIEGNYLLLDRPGWQDVAQNWSFSVFLEPDLTTIESRLRRRWSDHGLSPEQAGERALQNDLPNARLIHSALIAPDLRLGL